jgi:hypothetical protein
MIRFITGLNGIPQKTVSFLCRQQKYLAVVSQAVSSVATVRLTWSIKASLLRKLPLFEEFSFWLTSYGGDFTVYMGSWDRSYSKFS